jgi:predicted CXXCH cytochrome family protein
LRGPNGPVQMVCSDCHGPTGLNRPWPYSVAVVQPASQQPVTVGMTDAQQRKRRSAEAGAGPYMSPIRYVNQCAACHTLQFDTLIAAPAPHDKPEIVKAFIVSKLTELVREHPEVVRQPILTGDQFQEELPRSTLRPTRDYTAPVVATPSTPTEWVEQRALAAERLLWKGKCHVCHAETVEEGDKLPTSVKAVIPTRWLPHAEFDHEPHRMMSCESCHTQIRQSKQTSDINLPGIAICRQCHKVDGTSKGAAEGQCFECHSYHDWRKEQPVKNNLSITTLRGNG